MRERERRKKKKKASRKKKNDQQLRLPYRPRLVSRKARPISPARFSRAAARTSEEEERWAGFAFLFWRFESVEEGEREEK